MSFKRIDFPEEPAWIPCPDCDEFYCTTHDMHAFECPCPPIEDWIEKGLDPYLNGRGIELPPLEDDD